MLYQPLSDLVNSELSYFQKPHPLNIGVKYLDGYSFLTVFILYLAFCVYGKFRISLFSYQLKLILRIYNVLQVIINVVLFALLSFSISTRLVKVNGFLFPDELEATTTYLFYFSRIFDLLDTVFIVVRGKTKQLSFLHVYHHAWVLFVFWKGARYFPGAQGMWIMLFNAFVHSVMYIYYFLATFESLAGYLWWKRYITQVQILQLFGMLIVGVTPMPYIFQGKCHYPLVCCIEGAFFASLLISSFVRFHIRSYGKQNKTKQE